jgi:EAL domain-containing protein (putative c-di-GMP-specific phosphodiesterase class I)
LGCRIVAEGVEQAEQVDQIRRTGCQQMQGFYYARPVSLTALL